MVPNLKTDRIDDAQSPRASLDAAAASPKTAARGLAAVESPARRLQIDLKRNWAQPEPVTRWSARRRLGFILATNALLWVTLIWGVAKLV